MFSLAILKLYLTILTFILQFWEKKSEFQGINMQFKSFFVF